MSPSNDNQPVQGALNSSRTFLNQQTSFMSTMFGERIDEVAASLRKVADQLRADSSPPIVTNLAEQGAQRLEDAGGYFKGADAQTLLGDAQRVVRRNPFLAFSIAYVAGVSVSRFLKTSAAPPARVSDNAGENV